MYRCFAPAFALLLFVPGIAFAQDSGALCVERVSVVEGSFITIFDARKSSSKIETSSSGGPAIEYSDESKSSADKGIIEYGDNRAAAPGLDVVRGDETSVSEKSVDVVRGDVASSDSAGKDASGEDSSKDEGIDVFRGDETTSERPRPTIKDLGLSTIGGDRQLRQLVSMNPTRDGFEFLFDGLRLDVLATPRPESLGDAIAGLVGDAGGPSKIRIDTADTNCTPARFDRSRGLLELQSQAGHWLQMVLGKLEAVEEAGSSDDISVFSFDPKMKLKLARAKKSK